MKLLFMIFMSLCGLVSQVQAVENFRLNNVNDGTCVKFNSAGEQAFMVSCGISSGFKGNYLADTGSSISHYHGQLRANTATSRCLSAQDNGTVIGEVCSPSSPRQQWHLRNANYNPASYPERRSQGQLIKVAGYSPVDYHIFPQSHGSMWLLAASSGGKLIVKQNFSTPPAFRFRWGPHPL